MADRIPTAKPQPAAKPDIAEEERLATAAGLPAQERGERVETGKAISRGGRMKGKVPGATPSPK